MIQNRSKILLTVLTVFFLGLDTVSYGDLIWNEDSQCYIEEATNEYPPPVNPSLDNAELLWDDTHDTDGDDLYVNYSTLAGMLPGWGINATQIAAGPLTAALLSNYDILVLIDAESVYTGQEITDIQNWIAGGGKLLMIGEHVGAFNPEANNLVIAPYNIQFYDYPGGYVTGATNFAAHPITAGLTEISWAAGDALSVNAPADALAWNTSNANGLAVNESGVVVVVMGDSNMMDNTYIGNDDNIQCMQNVMNYLGITYEPFDVVMTLTPVNPPIQIPIAGGMFEYDIDITNNDVFAGNFDGWIYAALPGGGQTGALLLRTGLTLAPGTSIIRPGMTQNVPSAAPAGTYSYTGCVGQYSNNDIYSSDSFDFEKLGADGSSYSGGWELYGWGSQPAVSSIVPAASKLRISGPNPFNPETSICFDIAEAGEISLKVFNAAGQMVSELVSGYTPAGEYTVKFNAGSLSSGIYFAKLETAGCVKTVKLLLTK